LTATGGVDLFFRRRRPAQVWTADDKPGSFTIPVMIVL